MGKFQRASMMGVLGTQGGFGLVLFQGWGGRVKYSWKMWSRTQLRSPVNNMEYNKNR